MQNIRLIIGQSLLIGIVISFLLIITGGVLYLSQHSMNIVNYKIFRGEPILLTSLLGIFVDAFSLSPRGMIQLGLLVLLLVQILRVALTAWFFIKERSMLLCGFSLFILFILISTLLFDF